MLKTKPFQGANVFMSRNLVPPEVFDKLHDAVKDNGAQIHLCCDPSRNGPNDYHIISSSKHEKFDDLKSKGCKLLGPICVLSCAKGGRPLPKQGFTCCLAMDGVKVLASGFDTDEKMGTASNINHNNVGGMSRALDSVLLTPNQERSSHSPISPSSFNTEFYGVEEDAHWEIARDLGLSFAELWNAANAYESMLRQKARVNWIKEGDRNSAYFHKIINYRRRHNAIQGLTIDGMWIQEPSSVKNEAFNHFKERFSEQNLNRPTLDGVKIEELVAEMGGVLHTKASLDLNFVVVKNVLAAKYKWALNILKKPIVTYEWLKQCSDEHRVVPQESYKVLPFSGLKICVTGIPAGDKYKVAKRWGHIHIVTRKWFDQSIARKACLNEELFAVQHGSVSSHKVTRDLTMQHSQEKDFGKLHSAASSGATDSNVQVFSCAEFMDRDLEATQSEHMSSVSNVPLFAKEADSEPLPLQTCSELNFDGAVANDSESDDNDLYLSECRILLVGFEACEMRKLVNMVRKGGGSRYMSFNDKLTHIVIGNPTEMEKKDVRSLAALGVIYVVKTAWLEDCDREKKQVPVLRRHIAYDLLYPKAKGAVTGSMSMDHAKISSFHQRLHQVDFEIVKPESLEKRKEEKKDMGINGHSFSEAIGRTMLQNQLPDNKLSSQRMTQHNSSVQYTKSANRGEVVQWITQGGGEIISGQTKQSTYYTIECHGVTPTLTRDSKSLYISSHWIRSCLEAGSLLDVDSHILYSPLPCRVPLPGFESFRFCFSQYDEKDRNLLRNLCFHLGAKYGEKLTKKVTHLLCKFTNGPKYEAACKWGIQSVTSEWIFECVKQNGVVAIDQFLPKEVTAQDRDAGICTVSQFPTQAVQMISDLPSQLSSQSQTLRGTTNKNVSCGVDNHETSFRIPSNYSKKARLVEEPCLSNKKPSASNSGIHADDKNFSKDNMLIDAGEAFHAVPDVAAAIEDLLEQTSKMHDQRSPAQTGCERSIYPSDRSVLSEDNSNPHTVFGLSKHWLNRSGRKDDNGEASQDRRAGIYDGFSETQTESQVVSYEEDLSGRQMLIDRVRTRSSLQ
ncbi:DNA topoisomerase 2-binding protein 1-A [Glycine max]|nr:DNA topoisomerase 2-binding protein 1-A [Glycine max]